MSDDSQQNPPIPRIEELEAASDLKGEELRAFLVNAIKRQFDLVSDDPLEVMMGGLTIGAMVQTIVNDMKCVGASQSIIDALDDVRLACKKVKEACEAEERNSVAQTPPS